MRTFVAITTPPTGPVPAYLDDCRNRLDWRHPDVKWVVAIERHITLNFLGEISPEQLPDVHLAVARTAASCQPFDALLTGWGAFPAVSRPHTLWVGADAPNCAFRTLERALAAELAAIGISPERKPFHPHITLGRVRSPRRLDQLVRALKSTQPATDPITFRVDCITLYESVLSPAGPLYTVLLRAGFSMTGDRSDISADAETTVR